ncbi:hypothetical protein IAT38_002006 [Cryptococcus sp. DSM 104549]
MSSPAPSISDGLELTDLSLEALFTALTNVEKAVPELLLQVKPILAHLSSPDDASPAEESAREQAARDSAERYMLLLDKIQFVLRQTAYYLRETRASPNTLRPPPADSIPTPFASTISTPGEGSAGANAQTGTREAELGLYASRIEAKTLADMAKALRALRALRAEDGEGDRDRPEGAGGDSTQEEAMAVDDGDGASSSH